jgi:chromosome segregation ATPase
MRKLESRLKAVQLELEQERARIKTLEASRDQLQREIQALEARISNRNAEVAALCNRISLVESDRGNLTGAIRVLVREDDVTSGRARMEPYVKGTVKVRPPEVSE